MRITSGEYKNRRLFVPEGKFIRPTSDRMRQSIFNILRYPKWDDNFELSGARVMDVFCGSGSLGLEALSNGAVYCLFVDQDARTVRDNTGFISEDDFDIRQANVLNLKNGSGDIDLVFMDPPYNESLVEPAVKNLIDQNYLADGAILIIETEKGCALDLSLDHLDTRSQAQSDLHFFRYNAAIK